MLRRTPFSDSTTITGAGIKSFGNDVILWAKTDDNLQGIELRADRRVLLSILHRLMDWLDVPDPPDTPLRANRVTPAVQSQLTNWDWVTPQMVIDKFRNSPNLRPMLNDVIAVLGDAGATADTAPDVERVKSQMDVNNLFFPMGHSNAARSQKLPTRWASKTPAGIVAVFSAYLMNLKPLDSTFLPIEYALIF